MGKTKKDQILEENKVQIKYPIKTSAQCEKCKQCSEGIKYVQYMQQSNKVKIGMGCVCKKQA